MTETQQAYADRWKELRAWMAMDPQVEWQRIWQLMTELHSGRQAGSCHRDTVEDMEAKGLY
jgi:hypothetical protein